MCWRTEYNEVVVTCHRFERRQTLINQQWSKFFVATVQRDQMVRLFAECWAIECIQNMPKMVQKNSKTKRKFFRKK